MSPATFSPTLGITYTGRMIRQFDTTETRFRSLFELRPRRPRYPALPDDGQQRADSELTVVWDGKRDLPASVRRCMTI